ncbi:hypothetical protein O181_016740 [Austropuccinia psidii MF-1]|uniref:Uncharacterized protein n=1 Tax=Austropuccinia psidii MF-1 TaxID=1389203 RepID=A0A9Q3GSA8_9BASI|nr:hypothetical protein [Austropuccinia psidii MF-1]
MKPKSLGHVLDNTLDHQADTRPDSVLENKSRSTSKYQDVDNMCSSEEGEIKQLPEASSWPKFNGVGKYDHMERIYYIFGLLIDLKSIPDYWITARLNKELKGHASIWYTEMKEIHGKRN